MWQCAIHIQLMTLWWPSGREDIMGAMLQVTSRAALLEAGFPALEQTAFVEEDFVDVSSEDCELTVRGLSFSGVL